VMLHCDRCVFWHQLGDRFGLCRRVAPVPRERAETIAHWPMTGPHEGCGDGVTLEAPSAGRVRCGDCAFWRTTRAGGMTPRNRGDEHAAWWNAAGLCTRHAPHPSPDAGNRGFWCATNRNDGCGEGQAATPTA